MGPKRTTRTTKTPTNRENEESSQPSLPQLTKNDNEQRRIFILPKCLSANARVLTLPNPATASKCRYCFCPIGGLFEFIRIGLPSGDLRSWLITQSHQKYHYEDGAKTANPVLPQQSLPADYVLESPDLFIATPIDPVFFLLPLFQSATKTPKASFRLDDDYMDLLTESSPEIASALRLPGFRTLLLKRLRAVSEVQEFGDDVLFKPNDQKVAQLILEKGRSMTKDGVWPLSMERAFVKKQLEIPTASVPQANPQLPTPEQSITSSDLDSQVSETSNEPALESEPSTASTEVEELMRLRVALSYITSSYLPKDLRSTTLSLISSNGLVDYTILDQHLQKVQTANAQVQALRSLSDNISRKRSALDDDEALEARAEKRRKKEEEEKRKKAESRATKELKKVDTSGMKKLSSFFTKPAVTGK